MDDQPRSASLADRNHFLLRKLHSLTGIVPVGAFLCFHLLANSAIMFSGAYPGAHFQESVQRIHLLEPFLLPVEVLFIFIPIVFHALLGFQILFSGRSNTQQYRYGGNIRYLLQRVTGVVAFVFILFHIWQLHRFGKPFGGGAFELFEDGVPVAATKTAAAIQSAVWIAPFYAIGVVCAVYHLANGIWTTLITWGITIGPRSQTLSGRVCVVLGIVLGLAGLGALNGFRTMDASTLPSPGAVEHHTADPGGAPDPRA